jgi:hypothetical protein
MPLSVRTGRGLPSHEQVCLCSHGRESKGHPSQSGTVDAGRFKFRALPFARQGGCFCFNGPLETQNSTHP